MLGKKSKREENLSSRHDGLNLTAENVLSLLRAQCLCQLRGAAGRGKARAGQDLFEKGFVEMAEHPTLGEVKVWEAMLEESGPIKTEKATPPSTWVLLQCLSCGVGLGL